LEPGSPGPGMPHGTDSRAAIPFSVPVSSVQNASTPNGIPT
jgi:hypothetical protein